MYRKLLFILSLVTLILINGCQKEQLIIDRYSKIPPDAIKELPENDFSPPRLHSNEYKKPVPLGTINTAGAEDSPFILADRKELYFFFTPDVSVPPEKQLLDEVTGIYVSKYSDGAWQEAERVILQNPGKLALDGCEFVQYDTMLFCTAREGYTGLHWFSAKRKNDQWTSWKNADFDQEFEVGELHIHDNELYYHSSKEGGKGGTDIWMLTNIDGRWQDPVNVEAVNSEVDDGYPFITADGQEMWINRWYMGTPAVFRSKKIDGQWSKPELTISQFAGEPTLDEEGNIYFVHHYYKNGQMIEADIYVAEKK
ncbi:MAG: hypothetical protein V1880_00440 [Patescibacteria group bacterium]